MEKTYISPDIIVVEMENNLMAENAVSRSSLTPAAGDSGANLNNKPESGDNGGTTDVPESSKDNAFDPWSTWDD